MKVAILDSRALASVSLMSLRSHLKSRAWNDEGSWAGGRATVYSKEANGKTWDILVPTRDTVADYDRSMASAISILSEVEERSEIDVFHELNATSADVIQLSSININGAGKKILSLHKSRGLLTSAYDMMASAARATEKKRAAYRGKISADVKEYLEAVYPLPEYYEGCNLTLYSPVTAIFNANANFFHENHLTPFSRKVTQELSRALQRTDSAIAKTIAEDTIDHFDDAIADGVSANLCTSLASLTDHGDGIAIDMAWAIVRQSEVPASHFKFSKDSAGILNEAASLLRRSQPILDESIVAHVVKLERGPEDFDGKATISGFLPDQGAKQLKIEFDSSVYDTVITAFQKRQIIHLEGDIHHVGNSYELQNPRNLSLADGFAST